MTTTQQPAAEETTAPSITLGRSKNRGSKLRGRRPNTLLIAVGVLLIALSAAAGAFIVQDVSQRHPYVAAVRDIPYGQTIQAADLAIVDVSASRINAVRGDQLHTIVGQVATSTIPGRTLISEQHLSANSTPVEGAVSVGVRLSNGRVPSDLQAGRTVQLIEVGTAGPVANQETSDTPRLLADNVRVTGVVVDGSVVDVTVQVPADRAMAVADAAAMERVAILVVSEMDL